MLWDVETRRELATLDHEYPVTSVAFSGDGTTLATSDWQGKLTLWSVPTRQETHQVLGHSGPATCVVFSPTQDMLVSADSKGIVKAWHVPRHGLEPRGVVGGHAGIVADLAFSPDGKSLASCSNNGIVKLWDIFKFDEVDTFRCGSRVGKLAFSHDGKTLAVASHDGIKHWDTSQRQPPNVLSGAKADYCGVVFSPNGKTLVSWSWDNIVRIWDTGRWEVRKKLPHAARVIFAGISPDGKTLATAGKDSTIRLWSLENVASDETLAELRGHPGWIWSVAFSPDGQRLISAGGGGPNQENGTVRLWDSVTGEPRFTFPNCGTGISCLARPSDGKMIGFCCRDVTIRLLHASTEEDVRAARWYEN